VDDPPSPRVFGDERIAGRRYLYLEAVRRLRAWPWATVAHAAAVSQELARLHDAARLPRDAFPWDYESYLAASAASTLATAGAARDAEGRRYWRRLGDLRRVVAALAQIRGELLAGETVVLHGDVHPGNVIICGRGSRTRPMLIDWGRARIGSPLEDVASWLHSLGCWEPQARRRHDTLWGIYLASRQRPRRINPGLRRLYWLASASNGLSGAIRVHLDVLSNPATRPRDRHHSLLATHAWARVIRRAAALLTTTHRRYS
jgi:aminoglycoside phosphotransferase (APT) family kinase protein